MAGFTLVETMISMLLLTAIVLAVSQLVATSVAVNRAAKDLTNATTLASEKAEELKNLPFNDLMHGGSVAADVEGYHDTTDTEGDGQLDFLRRWQVTDLGDRKIVRVRTEPLGEQYGEMKQADISVLVTRP